MRFVKKVISKAPKCYSLAPFVQNGKYCFLVATEKQGPCQLFDEDGALLETVWTEPGGVMTMAQLPGKQDSFLATWQFYSPNDSAQAKIVIAQRKAENNWSVRTLVDAPFVHRFGILERGGVRYLLVCCLKSGHAHKDDWSMPGKVFAAVLPDDLSGFDSEHQLPLTELKHDMGHNHGYSAYRENGVDTAVVTCDAGVFQFVPPAQPNGAWSIRTLYDAPVSDAVLHDLDGDGVPELCCMAPFHGDKLFVCRKNAHGAYEKVWEMRQPAEMLHATCACSLQGKNTWVVGYRKGDRELLAITCQNGAYKTQVIDSGCGSANVMHFVNKKGEDVLVAANREIDEAALYTLQ